MLQDKLDKIKQVIDNYTDLFPIPDQTSRLYLDVNDFELNIKYI